MYVCMYDTIYQANLPSKCELPAERCIRTKMGESVLSKVTSMRDRCQGHEDTVNSPECKEIHAASSPHLGMHLFYF